MTYGDNLDEINLNDTLRKKLKKSEDLCLDLIQFQQAIAMGEKNCKDTAGGSNSWTLHKKLWAILESGDFTQAQRNKALLSYAVGVGGLTKSDLEKLHNFDRNDGTSYQAMIEAVELSFGVGKSKKKPPPKGEKPEARTVKDWTVFEEVPQWSMEWPKEVIRLKNKVVLLGEQFNKWTPLLRLYGDALLSNPNPEDESFAPQEAWDNLNSSLPLVGSEAKDEDAKAIKKHLEEQKRMKEKAAEEEKAEGKSRFAGRWSGQQKTGGVLVIYVVGGYTYAELQVIYELVAKFQTNVYIGGSCMYTGKTFCQAIENGVVA